MDDLDQCCKEHDECFGIVSDTCKVTAKWEPLSRYYCIVSIIEVLGLPIAHGSLLPYSWSLDGEGSAVCDDCTDATGTGGYLVLSLSGIESVDI